MAETAIQDSERIGAKIRKVMDMSAATGEDWVYETLAVLESEAASTLPPTAAEPSEPKADGFDEWFAASGYVESFRPNALEIWNVGEQSGVRKGMQGALDIVRGQGNTADQGYMCAIRELERAFTAELAKEQQ